MNIEKLNHKLMTELTLEEYQKLSCVMFEMLDRLYGMKPKEMEIDRKATKPN